MKSIFIWGGVGIVIVAGLIAVLTFVGPQQQTPGGHSGGSAELSVAVTEQDHRKGNLESPIAFVEYGDFQCPACKAHIPLLQQLEQEFGSQINFVYRHLPLRNIHFNAEDAARASEAAALQGKFWEMHDLLFEKQDEWARERSVEDIFVEYAVSLGLNPDQFQEDFKSDQVRDRVQEDLQAALQDGLQSTPSFFVNGQRATLREADRYQELRNLIVQALLQHEQEQQSELPESSESTQEPTDQGS